VQPTSLDGVLVVEPEVHRDQRGFFLESYHKRRFMELGISDEFVQDNHSRSARGVLRGIHFQDMSAPMAKLVRCTAGRILDVAVDLRAGSPTFGRWWGVELSADNMRQLLVPVGFGHAFLTLSDAADVQYKCSGYYSRGAEGAIAWNDPELAIDWPIADPVVSSKDQAAMRLSEYRKNPVFRYEPAAR
jgi:dTDP-4-dehydrorhamnose 3,5-epimerase